MQRSAVRQLATGVGLLILSGALWGCGTSERPADRAGGGAAIGAATGGAIGLAFGGIGAIPGALIGGAIGGTTGAVTDEQDVNLGEPVWR